METFSVSAEKKRKRKNTRQKQNKWKSIELQGAWRDCVLQSEDRMGRRGGGEERGRGGGAGGQTQVSAVSTWSSYWRLLLLHNSLDDMTQLSPDCVFRPG